MTNHPKDRHVLATAARAGVKVTVTYNFKDFSNSSLAPYAITAQGPSAFLKHLYDMAPSAVMQTLEAQAAAIGQPIISAKVSCEILGIYCSGSPGLPNSAINSRILARRFSLELKSGSTRSA